MGGVQDNGCGGGDQVVKPDSNGWKTLRRLSLDSFFADLGRIPLRSMKVEVSIL
jgi:hypothetical protein